MSPVRHLTFVVAESGRCKNCLRQAGEHGIDGACQPGAREHATLGPDDPRQCYRGEPIYAFVDIDRPHTMGELAEKLA